VLKLARYSDLAGLKTYRESSGVRPGLPTLLDGCDRTQGEIKLLAFQTLREVREQVSYGGRPMSTSKSLAVPDFQ